jgi:subtilase family serine protease
MNRFVCRGFVVLITFAIASWTAIAPAQVTIPGSTPDEASKFASAPSLPASQTLNMQVILAIRNRAALDKLIAEQQNPSSPKYHRWLTPKEFAAQFGPSQADVQRVSRWLQHQGFTIVSTDVRERTISFTGDVGQAASAFGVRIASEDGVTFSNTNDPAVPADLALLIESINGLSNMIHAKPAAALSTDDGSPDMKVNGNGPAFGPPDVYTFYDESSVLGSGVDGTGADCIGLVEDSNFDTASTTAFNTQFTLPAFTSLSLKTVDVDGTNPGTNGDELETLLDIEWSHAAAPGAPIVVYLGDPANNKSGSPIVDAITTAVNDNTCGAIAISFSICGAPAKAFKALDTMFAQAASQGQAVFEASGDEGAAGIKLDKKKRKCVVASTRMPNDRGFAERHRRGWHAIHCFFQRFRR